jgi:hypothetical protein
VYLSESTLPQKGKPAPGRTILTEVLQVFVELVAVSSLGASVSLPKLSVVFWVAPHRFGCADNDAVQNLAQNASPVAILSDAYCRLE